MTNFLLTLTKKNIALLITLFFLLPLSAQINFPEQSTFKYLKGNQAQTLPTDWMGVGFDDSAWETSNAPFWYGDGVGGTELTDMFDNYSAIFLRSTFTASNIESINNVIFSADWDDGFILWVNGDEVLNQQGPTSISYDAVASDLHESGINENFTISTSNLNLVEGENTIAVIACNIDVGSSSDFHFDVSLSAITEMQELVDTVGVSFSRNSGFYSSAFNVTLSTNEPGASIVYTLDGSNPQTSLNSTTIANNTAINIDPNSSSNRGLTPAVVVRASITKSGFKPAKPKSRTYIFLDEVLEQTNPGHDWPNYDVNGQRIDYDFENNPDYADQMVSAFTDIPSISVVTDNANLFDANTGIYVNAMEQGRAWERECSVELIDPQGGDGFNVNAGLRIRGGYSRNDWFPKHAFRLFFRSEYGDSKLYYPLFGDEGVDRFDKIDLRTSQNYSWANGHDRRNTFVREVFARDAQAETGHYYTRSRYYHLYLNGMYWGLFQTQERAEARWASDYMGGKTEEFDVIKVGGVGDYDIEATDGNLAKWQEVYNISASGFINNSNYYRLEGKDAKGVPMKNSEILVDIDNLIDYMINIFYSGNFDAPVSAFGNNKFPNNFYAITNRDEKLNGFRFMIHDAEHTMMINESWPTVGLYENRVNIGNIGGDTRMEINGFGQFNPQWLHHRLTANTEYRQRFADLAWKRLNSEGIFSEDKNNERLNNRAAQIDLAIIAESGRWGDTHGEVLTKHNSWLPELQNIRSDYFPYRTGIVIDQLAEVNLYAGINPPIVSVNGTNVFEENTFINGTTEVSLGNTTGDIYYTINGQDPRLVGGGINPSAKLALSGQSISVSKSMVLKARVNRTGSWSALRTLNLIADQVDYSKLKVTELHYHPTDSINGTDTINDSSYEFIEFRNTSMEHAINLSGLVLDSAVYYEFPENKLLAPGEYFVVATKPKKFYDRYGWVASGNCSGTFNNATDLVLITNRKGQEVIKFRYYDEIPWMLDPDGTGVSLTSRENFPTGDPNDWDYWKPSSILHGTPFRNDSGSTSIDDENESEKGYGSVALYPNPTRNNFEIVFNDPSVKDFDVDICNINGQSIYKGSFEGNTTISMTELNASYGLYFVTLKGKLGIQTIKIVYSPE